jgi:hypothetical protein
MDGALTRLNGCCKTHTSVNNVSDGLSQIQCSGTGIISYFVRASLFKKELGHAKGATENRVHRRSAKDLILTECNPFTDGVVNGQWRVY